MCDSSTQWAFERLGTGSDETCKPEVTETECEVTSTKYTGECSSAPSDTCPNTLKALVNAWIQLNKSGRLRK